MASDRLVASIGSLAVYSPEYGLTEETEDEKLLFYYPDSASTDIKLRHVGLCEAMVNFTRYHPPLISVVPAC